VIGALLIVAGAVGAGWSLRAATSRRRPLDLLGALAAPVFVVAMLVGGLLLLSPRFLS
jgi:hypothetical protein